MGVNTSQCPTCGQPGWKNDLQTNHLIMNAVQKVKELMSTVGQSLDAAKVGPGTQEEEIGVLQEEIALLEAALVLCDQLPPFDAAAKNERIIQPMIQTANRATYDAWKGRGTRVSDKSQTIKDNVGAGRVTIARAHVIPDSQEDDVLQQGTVRNPPKDKQEEWALVNRLPLSQSFGIRKRTRTEKSTFSIKAMFESHRKKVSSQTCDIPRVFRIVWSSSGGGKKKNIALLKKKLAECLPQVEEDKEVEERTTHVILETDKFLIAKQRTRKYLGGCALGCWVVSSAWVDACIQEGGYVPEAKYQIRGVKIRGAGTRELEIQKQGIGYPDRSRKRMLDGKPRLFSGMRFFVAQLLQKKGQSDQENQARIVIIKRLLLLGGGTLVQQEQATPEDNLVVISDNDKQVMVLQSNGFKRIVEPCWVYDCLTVGTIIDTSQYVTV